MHLETLYIVQTISQRLQKIRLQKLDIHAYIAVCVFKTTIMFLGKRCVFNNFLKISNELADLISVGSLFHALAAVTVKVRSPALLRVLGQQIRNKSVLERRFGLSGWYNSRQFFYIYWSLVMKGFVNKQQDLEHDSFFYWEPVKWLQQRSWIMTTIYLKDNASRPVL